MGANGRLPRMHCVDPGVLSQATATRRVRHDACMRAKSHNEEMNAVNACTNSINNKTNISKTVRLLLHNHSCPVLRTPSGLFNFPIHSSRPKSNASYPTTSPMYASIIYLLCDALHYKRKVTPSNHKSNKPTIHMLKNPSFSWGGSVDFTP